MNNVDLTSKDMGLNNKNMVIEPSTSWGFTVTIKHMD